MRVPKHLIGKEVRLTWQDPMSDHDKLINLKDARKGRNALAKWRERGVIDDITEGVVRFIQSETYPAGDENVDEVIIGWIPEELITRIELAEYKELE